MVWGTLNPWIAAVLGIFSFIGLLFDVVTLVGIWQSGYLGGNFRNGNMYTLAFAHILAGGLQQVVVTFYLCPCAILQRNYLPFSAETAKIVVSFFSTMLFFMDLCLQAVIAVNRLVVIVRPFHGAFFSRRNGLLIVAVIVGMACLNNFFSYFVLPCCAFVVDYSTLSFRYEEHGFNYVAYIFDWPSVIVTVVLNVSCYSTLFFYVYRMNQQNQGHERVIDRALERRRYRELRFAVQFAACFVFLFFAWIVLAALPSLVSTKHSHLFTLTTVFVILHSSVNAAVLFFFNADLQRHVRVFLGTKHTSIEPMVVTPRYT